jgi:hypothetical protein
MGINFKSFRSPFVITGLLAMSLSQGLGAADSIFMPSITEEAPPAPVGGDGIFALGIFTETFTPISSGSFESRTAGQQSMRYQVPVSFGLEATYSFTKSLEAGLSGGYERFETQQFTGRDTLNNKQYDVLQYKGFPVLGLIRMRWQQETWAPEVEVAGGAILGKIKTRSTQLNAAKLDKSGPFYKGHVSVGSGFEWGEDYTLHFHLGYAMTKLGEHTYAGGNYTITQKNFHHGIFFKGLVRYQF